MSDDMQLQSEASPGQHYNQDYPSKAVKLTVLDEMEGQHANMVGHEGQMAGQHQLDMLPEEESKQQQEEAFYQ